jgi:hypothetical protein
MPQKNGADLTCLYFSPNILTHFKNKRKYREKTNLPIPPCQEGLNNAPLIKGVRGI